MNREPVIMVVKAKYIDLEIYKILKIIRSFAYKLRKKRERKYKKTL